MGPHGWRSVSPSGPALKATTGHGGRIGSSTCATKPGAIATAIAPTRDGRRVGPPTHGAHLSSPTTGNADPLLCPLLGGQAVGPGSGGRSTGGPGGGSGDAAFDEVGLSAALGPAGAPPLGARLTSWGAAGPPSTIRTCERRLQKLSPLLRVGKMSSQKPEWRGAPAPYRGWRPARPGRAPGDSAGGPAGRSPTMRAASGCARKVVPWGKEGRTFPRHPAGTRSIQPSRPRCPTSARPSPARTTPSFQITQPAVQRGCHRAGAALVRPPYAHSCQCPGFRGVGPGHQARASSRRCDGPRLEGTVRGPRRTSRRQDAGPKQGGPLGLTPRIEGGCPSARCGGRSGSIPSPPCRATSTTPLARGSGPERAGGAGLGFRSPAGEVLAFPPARHAGASAGETRRTAAKRRMTAPTKATTDVPR